MSNVGGVGEASGAINIGGAGETKGVEPVGSASSITACSSESRENLSNGYSHSPYSSGNNMSTQSFVELHNTAITHVNEVQSSGLDFKKLIEMMIAIELLKAINEK